jgi:cell division protein FtsW
VVGEELGFIGAVALVGLFAGADLARAARGLRAPDAFGAHLALGITLLIAIQTLLNLGVVTGCCRPRACRCRSSRSAARPCW